jgi:hypothetical protein
MFPNIFPSYRIRNPVTVNMNNKCAVEWMENGTVKRFQTSTVYCQFLWNLCMGKLSDEAARTLYQNTTCCT